MELTGWKEKLQSILEWVMRLAYVNILWLCGILLGLVAAGFFPATIAMFAVIRKWLLKDDDLKAGAYFWKTYKSEMLKGNAYGYIWLALGLMLYFDLTFFRSFSNLASLIFTYITFILGVVYTCALLFAFPVYVHYDQRVVKAVKNSILLTISSPVFAIVLVVAFGLPYYAVFKLPGLLPFYGGSLISFCLLFMSIKLFENLDNRQLKKD
ncbi:MAG TPA: YesL family protein [Bacillaceae bacterium]